MSLTPGTRLGVYEITALVGEGGMGQVYRASDTKLKRQVAIKILPAALAADHGRLARFQREAEVLASLNHPHIAAIYGLEDSNGITALVMELVEGDDLSQALARGPMPLDDALPIARQITEALEAAHEQGIIHRDLKPANIKVRPDGTVKVLDFGLAKALEPTPASAGGVARENSPTITSPAMTQAGMLLGTAAYMAPEQAKGKAVDKRADIWAFGCVLYEMLTGRKAFDGEDITDTIVAVMSRDPDWSRLATTPPHLTRLIRRCLDKDARRRLRDIGDARVDLDEGTRDVGPAPTPGARGAAWTMAPWLIAAALATALAWVGMSRPSLTERSTYVAATLEIDSPNLTTLVDRFSVAPDGSAVVLVGAGGLSLRVPGELTAAPIAGAPPGAFAPVFSPDGRWIAFCSGSALMKIPVTGGTPVTLVRGDDSFFNLTWGTDDWIRYPSADNSQIRSVSANGGPVESIDFGSKTWVTRAYGLPGGRLLVSIMAAGERTIAIREADGQLRTLINGWDGRLTPSGHLLFSRAEGATWSLAAVPFDARSGSVGGTIDVLAREIAVQYATPAGATADGDLYYLSGAPRAGRRIVTIDPSGAERDVALPPGAWVSMVRVAPDGRQLALNQWDHGRRSLWALTLATGALTRVTYDSDSFYPVWMPDSRRLLFAQFPQDRERPQTSMWTVSTDGAGRIEPIGRQVGGYPTATSADGRTLYYRFAEYRSEAGRTQMDIMQLALDSPDATPAPVVSTPAPEVAGLPSPDGRWLAYSTGTSGLMHVRVLDLADRTTWTQISTEAGLPIRWNAASTQLYYQDGDAISAIEIGRGGPIPASTRVAFRLPRDIRGTPDVMPGGSHAVVIRGGLIYQDLVIVKGGLRGR